MGNPKPSGQNYWGTLPNGSVSPKVAWLRVMATCSGGYWKCHIFKELFYNVAEYQISLGRQLYPQASSQQGDKESVGRHQGHREVVLGDGKIPQESRKEVSASRCSALYQGMRGNTCVHKPVLPSETWSDFLSLTFFNLDFFSILHTNPNTPPSLSPAPPLLLSTPQRR